MMGFPDIAGKVGDAVDTGGQQRAPDRPRVPSPPTPGWPPSIPRGLVSGLHREALKHGYRHQEAIFLADRLEHRVVQDRARQDRAAPSAGTRVNAPGDRSRASP